MPGLSDLPKSGTSPPRYNRGMSLIDDLRATLDSVPPSHQPSLSELAPMVGSLIAYAEHGPKWLQAAAKGAEAVDRLLSPPAPAPAPAAPPADAPVDESASQLAAENQQLRQQIQTLIANQQRTQVSLADEPAAA